MTTPRTDDRRSDHDGEPVETDGPGQGEARDLDHALVDCAVYEHGRRRDGAVSLEDAMDRARSCDAGFVWIGLHDPSREAVERIGEHFDLHPLAVDDAVNAHQRPKLEQFGDALFLVTKTVEYVEAEDRIEIGELQLVLGPDYVVTIRHGAPAALDGVRREIERDPERLALGPGVVFHAALDRVVDLYEVVLEGLSNDVDEVEVEVFSDERNNPAERIYRTKREVLAFKRAVQPLVVPVRRLVEDDTLPVSDRARPYLRDVLDHLVRDAEGVHQLDELLSGVLDANAAQLSVRQNDDMRKMSSWAAIAAVPTVVFGLYGMNFEHMPELGWTFGYPLVLLVVLTICGFLFRRLRRAGWI